MMKSVKPILDYSFTELFVQSHFKYTGNVVESPPSFSASYTRSGIDIPFCSDDVLKIYPDTNVMSSSMSCYNRSRSGLQNGHYTTCESFSSMNSESLSLCTEGLGSESSDDIEDLSRCSEINNDWQHDEEERKFGSHVGKDEIASTKKTIGGTRKQERGEFPPPISCIGRNGKPWVYFKSFRKDGRLILIKVRVPTCEFLHACRENGRLRLLFLRSDTDEMAKEEEWERTVSNEQDDFVY